MIEFWEDPAYLEEIHTMRKERRLHRRPCCRSCGHHLGTDTVYLIGDDYYCSDCTREMAIEELDEELDAGWE